MLAYNSKSIYLLSADRRLDVAIALKVICKSIFVSALLSACLSCSTPARVNFCDLVRQPKAFSGRHVETSADLFLDTHHGSYLSHPDCLEQVVFWDAIDPSLGFLALDKLVNQPNAAVYIARVKVIGLFQFSWEPEGRTRTLSVRNVIAARDVTGCYSVDMVRIRFDYACRGQANEWQGFDAPIK